MSTWIDQLGQPYEGDCRPGDRAATAPELALIVIGKAKREKAGEIATAYTAAIARGCPHRSKVIQLDAESRGNIGDMANLAGLVLAGKAPGKWPAKLESKGWRALDNTHLPVTPEEMIALSFDAMARFVAIRFRASALKDALAAARTVAEVEAIDASSGWE